MARKISQGNVVRYVVADFRACVDAYPSADGSISELDYLKYHLFKSYVDGILHAENVVPFIRDMLREGRETWKKVYEGGKMTYRQHEDLDYFSRLSQVHNNVLLDSIEKAKPILASLVQGYEKKRFETW